MEYSYYPGLDNLHALMVDTTQYFAHTDAVGNVIALTDSTQHLARTYSYAVWGASNGGVDSASFGGIDRGRFKGALWMGPQVDLYYMRARWYEPKSGRFLSEDPIGLAGGANTYAFGANDPVNRADPTGTCPSGEELWVIYSWRDRNGNGVRESNEITILGYYCVPTGSGGGSSPSEGAETRQVEPTECPMPPQAPPNANLNANIRKAESASLVIQYGNPLVADAWFALTVKGGGDWDYKAKFGEQFDPFGNFNYGAAGRAAGYSASTLLRMSGWAAERYDAGRSGNPSMVRALLGEPYPENPSDRANIAAGMQYYDNQCHKR